MNFEAKREATSRRKGASQTQNGDNNDETWVKNLPGRASGGVKNKVLERSKLFLGAAWGQTIIEGARGLPRAIWSPITPIRGRPGVDFGLRLGGTFSMLSKFEIFRKCTTCTRKPCFLRFGGSKIEPKWLQHCFKIASASK